MPLRSFLKQPIHQLFFDYIPMVGADDATHLQQTFLQLRKYSTADCLAIHSYFPWGQARRRYNTKGAAYLLKMAEQYPEQLEGIAPPLRAHIETTLNPSHLSAGDLFDMLQTLPQFPDAIDGWLPQLKSDLDREDLRLFERIWIANFVHAQRPDVARHAVNRYTNFKLKDLLQGNAFKKVTTTHELGYTLIALTQSPCSLNDFHLSVHSVFERLHRIFVSKKYLPSTIRGRAKEICLAGNLLIAIAMMTMAQRNNEIRWANTAFFLIDQVKYFQKQHRGGIPVYFPSIKYHTPMQYPIWLPCYMIWALEAKTQCLGWLEQKGLGVP